MSFFSGEQACFLVQPGEQSLQVGEHNSFRDTSRFRGASEQRDLFTTLGAVFTTPETQSKKNITGKQQIFFDCEQHNQKRISQANNISGRGGHTGHLSRLPVNMSTGPKTLPPAKDRLYTGTMHKKIIASRSSGTVPRATFPFQHWV
jgi:hypothetical protein